MTLSLTLNKSTTALPGETWATHPRYGHINVSNLGRVRNMNTGNIIGRITGGTRSGKPAPVEEKYISATIKGKTIPVHVLVLETFVGERPDGHEPDHLNFNRHDNRLVNLAWVTTSENQRRKRRR